MEIQKNIFEIIRSKIGKNRLLSEEISKTLNISAASAYRRIREEKELTVTELKKLCECYKISFDAMLKGKSDSAVFRYNALESPESGNYIKYVRRLADAVVLQSEGTDSEIVYMAEDIPIFHFLNFRELILFKIYAWYNAVSSETMTFEAFVRQSSDMQELFSDCERMKNCYMKTPSGEIWTENTLDTVLGEMEYNYEMKRFECLDSVCTLLEQMNGLVVQLAAWAAAGKKDGGADFRLYRSATCRGNSFMLFKKGDSCSATVTLFSANSITTSDSYFCREAEKWLNNGVNRAMPLSGASERDRVKFFQTLSSKIADMQEKLLNREQLSCPIAEEPS